VLAKIHESLTKHIPFASIFPLLKWEQVMRLAFISSRLLPAFIGSDLLTTTERSSISQPIDSAFPLRLYLPYLIHVCVRTLRDFPQLSVHSIPSILTLLTSMSPVGHIPLFVFLQDILSRNGFPVLLASHPASPPPLVHHFPG
jgi:hypothetical protein